MQKLGLNLYEGPYRSQRVNVLNDEEKKYYEMISSPWQLNCFCTIQPFFKDILKTKGDLSCIDL